MKAIVYSRPGDSDVLQLVDRPVPGPGPGEVRVRVQVSGVNPTDWKQRRGGPPAFATVVPNQDGAGTVDAVGPGVLAGRTLLVAGGAGAVGNAAIQLARWAGATVVTTVSGPEKAALARAAGADTVVNYRTEDAAAVIRQAAPEGVDLVVEVAPADNAAHDAVEAGAVGKVLIDVA